MNNQSYQYTFGTSPAPASSSFFGSFVQNNVLSIALFISFCILLFLLVRSILLWYWRVNEIVTQLQKIEFNTRKNVNVPIVEQDKKS